MSVYCTPGTLCVVTNSILIKILQGRFVFLVQFYRWGNEGWKVASLEFKPQSISVLKVSVPSLLAPMLRAGAWNPHQWISEHCCRGAPTVNLGQCDILPEWDIVSYLHRFIWDVSSQKLRHRMVKRRQRVPKIKSRPLFWSFKGDLLKISNTQFLCLKAWQMLHLSWAFLIN